MKILGIDPGTWRFGTGIIELSGSRYHLCHSQVIAVPKTLPIAGRLHHIYRVLTSIIEDHRPSVMALENIFYHKNIRAMIKIGEARACAMLAASLHEMDVIEYPPTLIKKAVTGNGRASKEQTQAMIKKLLNLKQTPASDAADALAAAICHLHHKETESFMGKKAKSNWRSKLVEVSPHVFVLKR